MQSTPQACAAAGLLHPAGVCTLRKDLQHFAKVTAPPVANRLDVFKRIVLVSVTFKMIWVRPGIFGCVYGKALRGAGWRLIASIHGLAKHGAAK